MLHKKHRHPERKIRCPLCWARRKTHRYFEDELCWIADCEKCKVPMIILKRHSMRITEAEYDHLTENLSRVADSALGIDSYFIDRHQKKIRDHLHWHARRVTNAKKSVISFPH